MPRNSITSKLTAAERQAILHADPANGHIRVSGSDLRQALRVKGYAELRKSKHLYLTDYGWRLHARLLQEHKPFSVEGVPWERVEEITDLYLLTGLDIDEIARRTRVKSEDVKAVLAFRRVLPAA